MAGGHGAAGNRKGELASLLHRQCNTLFTWSRMVLSVDSFSILTAPTWSEDGRGERSGRYAYMILTSGNRRQKESPHELPVRRLLG